MDLTKLYQHQISFTEWFEKMGHPLSVEMRKEDNDKRDRLAILNTVIGLPFDRPHQFPAVEIAERSSVFLSFLEEHGSELCALRLIPHNPTLPKLRMRGHTVREVLVWFAEQKIDPAQYKADFVPHAEKYEWSTIFVVNERGIFGEIIKGGHYQLTQGFYENDLPITFHYRFADGKWVLSREDDYAHEAQQHLMVLVQYLFVPDVHTQQKLQQELGAVFYNNHLGGYFETVCSSDFGVWFVDYNRILGTMLGDFEPFVSPAGVTALLKGQCGSPGKITGKVRIVADPSDSFEEGEILVCPMTTPAYLPLMAKAAGIITDLGGILSHAAIVAREMKKPCLVGTGKGTMVLKNGQKVELDAERGFMRLI